MARRQAVHVVGTPSRALDLGWESLHVDGCLRSARRHYDEAYRLATEAGDGLAAVRAAIGLGGLWVHEHRGAADAALVRQRQRTALEHAPHRSPERLELELRIAAEDDYAQSRCDGVLRLLPRARALGDPAVLCAALSLAQHCLLAPEHAELRAGLAAEMVEAAAVSDRPGDMAMALVWRAVHKFLSGDPHAERAHADLSAWLGRHPHAAAGFVATAMQVMLAVRAGRLEEAEALAVECARRGEAAGDVDGAGWFSAHLMAVRWYQGRTPELLPLLAGGAHSPELSTVDSSTFGALAVAAASAGDRTGARLAIGRLGGGDLRALPRSSSWSVTLCAAVETAHLLGDVDTARTAYELLLPHAARPMMLSLGVVCFGSTEYALGTAALTAGDRDLAVEHLRAAVRANHALGHLPAVLGARHRLAQALAGEVRDVRAGAEARTAPAAGPEGPAVAVHRHGRRWTLEWADRTVEVAHCVGMLYLSFLLAHPDVEVPAADLAAGRAGDLDVRADAALSATQSTLDGQARRSYRRRLGEIEALLGPEAGSDPAAGARGLREERDWILAQLAAASAPGGRSRSFTSNAERARISVGKAIRRAVDRIEEADAALGAQLRRTVQTGVRCCYRPTRTVRLALVDGRVPASADRPSASAVPGGPAYVR